MLLRRDGAAAQPRFVWGRDERSCFPNYGYGPYGMSGARAGSPTPPDYGLENL